MTEKNELTFAKEAAELDVRIRKLAWQECIFRAQGRIADLESLLAHQERQGLDSSETRGQIKAFRLVLEWMRSMNADEAWQQV
jgi:hypothetical protein